MKKQMFEEMPGSVHEAGAILGGRTKPFRPIIIRSSAVRAIRGRTSLRQSEFAVDSLSVETSSWEHAIEARSIEEAARRARKLCRRANDFRYV